VLILLARTFLFSAFADLQFGEVAVADTVGGGALREKADVVFIVFELLFLFELAFFCFGLD
jgi:hypothetical protein